MVAMGFPVPKFECLSGNGPLSGAVVVLDEQQGIHVAHHVDRFLVREVAVMGPILREKVTPQAVKNGG